MGFSFIDLIDPCVCVFSAYDYSIGPMDKAIVKTDIQIAVPPGCYGRVGELMKLSLASYCTHDSSCACQIVTYFNICNFLFLSSSFRSGSETLH